MKCDGCEKLGFSWRELMPDGLCPTCRWLISKNNNS